MKQLLIPFCFIFGFSFTQAQISSIIYPPDGTVLEIIGCDDIDPLPNEVGQNAVWDYSQLSGCEEDPWTITFHNAEGSTEAENFPSANKYLEVDIPPTTKILIYNNVDDSEWSVFGVKYNDAYVYFDEGEPTLQFPAELNDTWSFENTWAILDDSTSNMPVYTIEGEGTLILPNGVYENVIRVHSIRENSAGLFTEETYTYYSPEYHYHLFHMLVDDESQYQPSPIEITTSTKSNVATENIKIYPNPTNGSSSLNVELDVVSEVDIYLLNSLGERIYSEKGVYFIDGSYVLNFTKELANGIYFLQISKEGSTYTLKLLYF